jgi:hypothetical protein
MGKLWPWAAGAATAFVKEVLGADITWWPTALMAVTGIVNLVLAICPVKEPVK